MASQCTKSPDRSPFPPLAFSPRVFFRALVFLAFLGNPPAWGQFSVTDLGIQAPINLVQTLMGSGVTISNVSYVGTGGSSGIFTGGTAVVGFNSGIILSTGDAAGVVGTGSNYSSSVTSSTCWGAPGDPDLANLSGIPVTSLYDATSLSFDFTPAYNNITFQYVFASEEYNLYALSQYNDVFGFFLGGVNVALLPGGANVSINTVNNCVNQSLFIDNIGSTQGGLCTTAQTAAGLDTTLNGLTHILTVSAPVTAGVTYHIKLAIADAMDCRNDSDVFIKANSFVSYFTPTFTPTATPTGTPCGWPGITCTPTWTETFLPLAPTNTPCGWPGDTCTPSWSPTPTVTYTPVSTSIPTDTWTPDQRPTATFSITPTPTITPTPSPSPTPTITFTPTLTNTWTITPTPTFTASFTPTPSHTATPTSTATPTITDTPCGWPGDTCTPTFTPTPTPTVPFIDIFYVSKNVFSPSDPVSIFVEYTRYPGDYGLWIYNTAGEMVKTLDKARYLNGPVTQAYPPWNGTNTRGDTCAGGVYILYLEEPFDRKVKKVILVK